MNEYLYDVKMFATFRVTAESKQAAVKWLNENCDCLAVVVGEDASGATVTGEASQDGEPFLCEVNGEPV